MTEEALLSALDDPEREPEARLILLDWLESNDPDKAAALRADLALDPTAPTRQAWEEARTCFERVDAAWRARALFRYGLWSKRQDRDLISAVYALRWLQKLEGIPEAVAQLKQEWVCWLEGVDAVHVLAASICPMRPIAFSIRRTQAMVSDSGTRQVMVNPSSAVEALIQHLHPQVSEDGLVLDLPSRAAVVWLLQFRVLGHQSWVGTGIVQGDHLRVPFKSP